MFKHAMSRKRFAPPRLLHPVRIKSQKNPVRTASTSTYMHDQSTKKIMYSAIHDLFVSVALTNEHTNTRT